MRWKSVAIEELRNLESVRNSLEVIPQLIERQEAAIKRIRTSDPGTVVGVGGGNNDALLSAIVYRDELRIRLKEARKTVAAVERALEALSNNESMILDVLFIRPRRKGIDVICEELSVEKSEAYNQRNEALEKFTRNLYGCT